MARAQLARMRLYVVTDSEHPAERVADTVGAACAGGADVVQLRRKGDSGLELMRLAERCRAITAGAGVLFIVDDRLDVAMAAGADGVHLGQDDLPVDVARRLWPRGVVGCSTHSLDQALAAVAGGADYLGVGPVFATPTKPGRPPVGIEVVRAVAGRIEVPWVAIGGIDASTTGVVAAAGARAVAVVRAVSGAPDPAVAAAELREALTAATAGSR